MKKSFLSPVAAALLITTIVLNLTGCGSTKSSGDAKPSGESKEVSYPKKLTIFAGLSEWIAKSGNSNADNEAFKEVARRTGTEIEWIHPPTGGDAFTEKFNLMIASGDLPDIISAGWRDISGGPELFVEDKIIIPFTSLVDSAMPNVKKLMEEYPHIAKQFINDDRQILYIPMIRLDEELKVYQGPQIRQDWLDKLGLPMPKTTDDLYNVLKAFKEKDPNGNGQKDEIPMSGQKFKDGGQGIGQLVYPFGIHYAFYQEKGTVKHGVMQPEFKKALSYIKKLVSEGILDKDYVFLDRNKVDGKVMAEQTGFIFGMQPTKFMTQMPAKNPEFNMVAVPYLKGPDGQNTVFYVDQAANVTSVSLVITTKCKDPEGAAKWIDFLYGEEGQTIMNYGIEGVSFKVGPDGKKQFTELVTKNPDGLDISSAVAKYAPAKITPFPMVQRFDAFCLSTHESGVTAINVWTSSGDRSRLMPPVSLTNDEQQNVARKLVQINTIIDETIDKIILGMVEIDELDKLQANIQKMGMDEVIAAYQSALDRYNKR